MYQKDIFLQFRLDTSDNAHISYNDESNGDLRYATNKSGQWVTSAVESNGNVGWYTSLALDASDKAHIGYPVGGGDLWYATSIHIPTATTKPATKRTFSGETNLKYDYNARGLTKRTTYYYRVVAENEDGISYGDEVSFKTILSGGETKNHSRNPSSTFRFTGFW